MDKLILRPPGALEARSLTMRDMAAPIFRRRRVVSLVFLGVFCGALLSAFLLPRRYEAEMKILVNRDRFDAAVTPDPSAAVAASPVPSITEEDLNSEVELLKSRDLLESVVLASGLETKSRSSWARAAERVNNALHGANTSNEARLSRAVEDLHERLIVEPLKKTSLIRVAYVSSDPQLSAGVLATLATHYQEKHAAVHRPVGTFAFFDQQTSRYREELAGDETRLIDFDRSEGVFAPASQKQILIQQIGQFQAEGREDQSSAAAAAARAKLLRERTSTSPERQTTQIKRFGNAALLAQLQSTLLSLQLKRTELLSRYAASYPLVRDVEAQIAEAQQAVAQAQNSPVEETTTDRVPAEDWMVTELAKADADRAQLQEHAAATANVVRDYQGMAQQMDRKNREQEDLLRDVRTAEDDYTLYVRKREEARISDALDSKRIVNVSIAEAPTVPALATLHLSWLLVGGFFTAAATSVGTAYALDRLDTSLRTPDEIGRYLELKTLASIPTRTGV
jgi:uncharacterized protein involved in exopolysaccharide biosynthesis